MMQRNGLFYSAKTIGVEVDSETFKHLPAEMKEAILERQKKTEEQIQREANIKMLKEQLKNGKLDAPMKEQLELLVKQLESQNVNAEATQAPTSTRKKM